MSQTNDNRESGENEHSVNHNEDNNEANNDPKCLIASGDTIDAKSIFDVFKLRSTATPTGQLTTSVDSIIYNMRHASRGKCLIINNKSFDSNTRLNERRGTDMDAKSLYTCFRSLDFDVYLYTDPTANDIRLLLDCASKEDHSRNDCIVVCILTHGEQGVLWGRDEKYSTDSVFSYFRGDLCPSLAGKPKIFFIQACQGDKLDAGVAIRCDVTDSGGFCYRIPNFADYLICYSTIPGYYSWRNTQQGSWFVQALASVLGESASNMDLVTTLTIVSRKVAYDFESNVPNDPEFDKKKQIPCIMSMLTRLIYFPSKI